jgi:ribonuclease BN (tRNA processing enzyme)
MLAMSARHPDRLRLTVLGCSTAAPHPDWPASGHLVEWGETRLLLDAGPGVVRRLQRSSRPTDLSAVIVGHMHADHYLDLVALRYLFPWGEAAARPLPVFLPPGGRARLDALATAISERAGFFDAAFAISEFDPEVALAVGPLMVRFVRGRHYVPAWGVVIEAPDGARIAYTGDTGPSDTVSDAVRGVDLLLVEAALRHLSHDDRERGHLTAEEAVAMASRAGARAALLVHYAPARGGELETLCEAAGSWIAPAVVGRTITVSPGPHPSGNGSRHVPPTAASASAARDR